MPLVTSLLHFKSLGGPTKWDSNETGILMVEDIDKNMEPVEIVGSLVEAEEMIESDQRTRSPEADHLCPIRYVLFLRQANGRFKVSGEWT